MIKKTKSFMSGGSQAVRIPREFRFAEGEKVSIKKIGSILVLFPETYNFLKEFFASPETINLNEEGI